MPPLSEESENPRRSDVGEEVPLSIPKRPAFSPPQLLQAEYIGAIREEQRKGRLTTPTHPIDNVESHVVADRDDGVFVETQSRPNGQGYRVHVTIADVAAHVGLKTALGKAALARGFTVYGAGSNDPMFPKKLEEQMSLEHQQERLGFTISVDLDAHFKPVHTEFQPVITKAEAMSYAQAAERIATDPQLQDMERIAAGIRGYYFKKDGSERVLRDVFSGRDPYVSSSAGWVKTTDMVATYMLLANQCVAAFFAQSDLPYMYRNFNESDPRARYEAAPRGHQKLEEDMGLRGAYGHFTSPIRRASDFVNAHMAHFAYNALQGLEAKLCAKDSSLDRAALHHALWSHAPALLRSCSNAENCVKAKQDSKHCLASILSQELHLGEHAVNALAKEGSTWLQAQTPPLSSDEISRIGEHINALTDAPEYRAIRREAAHKKALGELNKETLAAMDKKPFSALLQKSAEIGEIPRMLYDEALTRIQTSRYDSAVDGCSILIQAEYPEIPRWNSLKRAVLRQIKQNPVAVGGILGRAKRLLGSDAIEESTVALPHASMSDNARDAEPMNVAILSKRGADGVCFSAPYYSVGHNERDALSHARYAFLEHYAFGELAPTGQTEMPNLLYAELENTGQSKRELIERMLKDVGATLHVSHVPLEHGKGERIFLTVEGGVFLEPMKIEGVGETVEERERSAFRRLLRNDYFKRAVASPLSPSPLINPQKMLEKTLEGTGFTLISELSKNQTPRGGFYATMSLMLSNGERVFLAGADAHNQDRAMRLAALRALETLGHPVEETGPSRSWASTLRETRQPLHRG